MKFFVWFLLLGVSISCQADYDRSLWRHWVDFDGDCQDTRQEVLARDSLVPVTYSADGCRVLSGIWQDPYTGVAYMSPSELDIDHVVPLKWAYEHGAKDWPRWIKRTFANDPENLLVVHKSVNRWVKRDKGPDRFMPQVGQRVYLKRFMAVANRYGLTGFEF